MLERVWRKGNPLTLLVGMQTSTATMENSVEIPFKTGNRNIVHDYIKLTQSASKNMFLPMFLYPHLIRYFWADTISFLDDPGDFPVQFDREDTMQYSG